MLQRFEEFRVAQNEAQHVQDGRPLGASERPQLRRIILQARRLDHGHVINRQCLYRHVAELRFERAGAGVMFGVEEFRVSGEAVREPKMIARRRRDQRMPPLARHLVGHQLDAHVAADGVRVQENHTRRREAVRSAVLRLHQRQIGVRRQPEYGREVGHDLAGFLPVRVGHGLLAAAEVDARQHARRVHLRRIAADHSYAAWK